MKRWAYIMLLGVAALPVTAQTDEDGPGRGVARVSVINGEVSVRRGDSGDLIAAAVNAPLVAADRLLTGPMSRAEVQFDWANMIRLGSDSEIRFGELEYRRYQIQVAIGTVTFRVLRDIEADVEVSTPNVSVRPVKRGVYRVSVREDGTSEITVRSGEVEVFTPRGSERLRSGRTMLARGTASDPEFQVMAAIPFDEWDRWNEARDRDLERSRSYQYVSSDIYGAEDLDYHGRWVDVDGYGWVWTPRVAVGWAPYRFGRWSWIDYYGWTWVSHDPWGWAPYHYGRWFHSPGYGWCWWPGGGMRHYWRPALVAFFGWGNYGGFRSGIGFGWGNVGWVPLGPREPFYPWYGSRWYGGYGNRTTFVNNTTIVNNTNVYNVYRNARVANSITSVNSDSFGRRHITNADLIRVTENDVRGAGLVRGALPLTPDRQSVQFADRQVRTADLPRTAENRTFFSRRPNAAVERVPFEQQRQTMDQVARRTFGDTNAAGGAGPVAGRGSESITRGGGGEDGRAVSRRAGEQGSGATTPSRGAEPQARPTETRAAESEAGRGWRRAGESEAPRTIQPTDRNALRRTEGGGESRSGDAVSRPATNWRRFGDSSGRGDQGVQRSEPSRVERSAPSRVEQRSEPSRTERSAPAPSVERPRGREGGGEVSRPESTRPGRERSDNGGWQRFGTSGGESSRSSALAERSFDTTRSTPSYSAPRTEARSERSGGYEPVRISPPIVRDRPSERFDAGGAGSGRGGGAFGGGSMSAPRMPSGGGGMSAPRMPSGGGGGGGMSTPRMPSGGGGARMSGGGGGGASRGGGGGMPSGGGSRGGRGR